MKDLIARPDAATGKTTAKETTKKWVCIVQYEHSDGSINQIIDEFPTKEEAYEAMKSTYDRYQWMNRCFNYENPWHILLMRVLALILQWEILLDFGLRKKLGK